MNKTKIYSAIAALGLTVGIGAEQVRFSELPGSVQKVINRNLNGGVVQEVERKTSNGQTVYEVEIRREGRNKHLLLNADGRILNENRISNNDPSVEVDVDTDRDIINKNDGKILGVVKDPDFNADVEARAGDGKVEIEADADKPRDRGVTEDVFDKNDGKILDILPAPNRNDIEADVDVDTDKRLEVEADVDTDDKEIAIETNEREDRGIFRKGDGKILGIPKFWRKDADNEVNVAVDTDRNEVTTDADGGLDTDKEDGRVLGVPKRGFETLSLNDVPPVVRETIQREAGGYKVVEVERASVDGRRVYEVDIERDGKNRELHVANDGTILKDTDREAVGGSVSTEVGTSKGN